MFRISPNSIFNPIQDETQTPADDVVSTLDEHKEPSMKPKILFSGTKIESTYGNESDAS